MLIVLFRVSISFINFSSGRAQISSASHHSQISSASHHSHAAPALLPSANYSYAASNNASAAQAATSAALYPSTASSSDYQNRASGIQNMRPVKRGECNRDINSNQAYCNGAYMFLPKMINFFFLQVLFNFSSNSLPILFILYKSLLQLAQRV